MDEVALEVRESMWSKGVTKLDLITVCSIDGGSKIDEFSATPKLWLNSDSLFDDRKYLTHLPYEMFSIFSLYALSTRLSLQYPAHIGYFLDGSFAFVCICFHLFLYFLQLVISFSFVSSICCAAFLLRLKSDKLF